MEMEPTRPLVATGPLVLDAETAADLMTSDPVSIREDADLAHAIEVLTRKDINAVPVLDGSGRAVGVLSRTDIIRFFRETGGWSSLASQRPGKAPNSWPAVREVMTPALLSVALPTTAVEVVARLLGLGNVQQLFVLDEAGVVVGVIRARDVLRRLRRMDTQ
jgi:CBS domain-containing protein